MHSLQRNNEAVILHAFDIPSLTTLLILALFSTANAADIKPQAILKTESNCILFAPDGKVLFTSDSDGAIRLWDVRRGKELRKLGRHEHGANCLVVTADGKTLASGGGGTIKLWEVRTGKELHILKGYSGHNSNSLAFSPDGNFLISGDNDNSKRGNDSKVQLWDVTKGKATKTIEIKTADVLSVAFAAEGQTAAWFVRGWKPTKEEEYLRVQVWDLRLDKERLSFDVENLGLVSFSELGEEKKVREIEPFKIWEIGGREKRGVLLVDLQPIVNIAVSPDRRFLAMGSVFGLLGSEKGNVSNPPNEIELWDLAAGKRLADLPGHKGGVHSLAFSPDGKKLASSGYDRTVKIWDISLSQGSE